MIRAVKNQHTFEEILALMEDLVAEWFRSKFTDVTEPQSYAIPLIHEKKNVLVSSPTGSGKTLTAFLSIINELYKIQLQGDLENRIYCVYISPLKALANDINRNLKEPLEEIGKLAKNTGREPPKIRVAVRSGDTSSYERQKMTRKPPHIFITTPESLAIVLSTPKFRRKFRGVRYVIVDEIHEVCSSKRGTHLSLSLERLHEQVDVGFVRIGLSATIAPIREVAKFLAGYSNGKLRDVYVVDVESRKRLDLRVLCPVADMTSMPFELVNARMYEMLAGLINQHRTTLIFTNTRSGTEHVSLRLKEKGVEELAAHHGSLSKFTRLDVEEKLKNGELRAAVSSTSLELGIDIGYIDLVCQVGSPKSIAKGLQRIGRAGHAVGEVSTGRMLVFDNDDLMECAALARNAYENNIDRVDIPRNCLDVLAQSIVGMSLERKWRVDEAFEIVKRSYSFHNLKKKSFMNVLRYLSNRDPDVRVYAKIWLDDDEAAFGRKRGSRLIYYTNVGTIPEEGNYRVFAENGKPLGDLSEKFVEYLKEGDYFVLGGRTYKFLRCRGMSVLVRDASGRRPTVPSWTGEMLPRSFDLSIEVGRFRRELLVKLKEGKEKAKDWLVRKCHVDEASAESMISYILWQKAVIPHIPSDELALIEGYVDEKGNRNLIFHYCFGRRVNDALSRAYAYALSNNLGCNVRVSVTDDNFMLTLPKRLSLVGVEKLVSSDSLAETLKKAIRSTELFKQRFRHCATRSFMILRSYKGRDVSVGRQQLRSIRLMDAYKELEDSPVMEETYNEILNEVMDITHAEEVLKRMENGAITVKKSGFSKVPSPFAHNVVLLGISDVVLMEDRSALLRNLQRQVLKRIIPKEKIEELRFTEDRIKEYFKKKFPHIRKKEDILRILDHGALNLQQQKGFNIYDYAGGKFEDVRNWCQEYIEEGKIESVWTPRGVLWCHKGDVPLYAAIFSRKMRLGKDELKLLDALGLEAATTKSLRRKLSWTSDKVTDTLFNLERAYIIARKGLNEILWVKREVEEADLQDSVERLIESQLDLRGPLSPSELAFYLDVGENLVKEILRELEDSGLVSSGYFMIGEKLQYMLSRDLWKLESKEKRTVFDERAIKEFSLRKQFRQMKSIDDYFDTFLEASLLYDVFCRFENLSVREWNERRRKGNILQGRFLRGRVKYVRGKDAPLFVSAYRRGELTNLDTAVLSAIKQCGGLELDQIVEKVGADKERVQSSVQKLDEMMYVVRKFRPTEGRTSKNVYVAFDAEEKFPHARKEIVKRFLKGYGPVPIEGIRGYTGFDYDEVRSILKELMEDGVAEQILVGNRGSTEMWILSEELSSLKRVRPVRIKDDLRILSLYDPWSKPLWRQITSKYGDAWIFPVIKNGELAGMIEKWEMSGCVEVRDIDLFDKGDLPDLLDALGKMMKFYKRKGYDILRITGVFGKDVTQIDTKIFLEKGYQEVNGFLAKGNFVPLTYSEEQILSYVMWKQHLHPENRFENTVEAIRSLGGARSEFELRLRVKNFISPEKLHRAGFLQRGRLIPEYLMYCLEEDLSLYNRARGLRLDRYARMLLSVIKEEEPISRKRIYAISPLGYGNTKESLKNLQKGLFITRDGQRGQNVFQTVRTIGISPGKARKLVLKRIISNFGIFSAEQLSAFTKGEFKMGETRKILRDLEGDGYLAKGFLKEGENTLYWIVREDLDKIPQIQFRERFVLTPHDSLFHYLRNYIRKKLGRGYCYVIFDGTHIKGYFEAKRKRHELTITDFQGEPGSRKILKGFSAVNHIWITEEREGPTDWEIMQWYEKVYGKSKLS